MNNERALVFNIQHYSLHDGPGIRTIVFFKGCPLRCRWCCNPESQLAKAQISYAPDRCIGADGCGFCGAVCPAGAIRFADRSDAQGSIAAKEAAGKRHALVDRVPCTDCLSCAEVCPSGALTVQGKGYTVEELADIVERDSAFFTHGNGGLTVSGGEPLMQGDFLIRLLREAKRRRLHTAIETCGYGDYAVLKEAAAYLDMIHFDIKSLDEERHRMWTGKSNQRILDNFRRLCADFPDTPKKVRTPVVPGFNDAPDQLSAIAAFTRALPGTAYELLPYHSFGQGKYKALGREYPMGDVKLSEEHFASLQNAI